MSVTIQQLQQMLAGQGLNGVAMTNPTASAGLSQYFNTPGFQLQYGSAPAEQIAQTGGFNPAVGFMQDPGEQLAVQQGMIPLMNNFAARGLGASGALSQALSQYMYNNYNNYTGGMTQNLNNYNNQLSNLVSNGINTSGASNAFNAGQNQANIAAQGNLSTGQNISNATQNTGQNISQLLGNQGVLNASAYLNTGAAQANNLFQGMSLLSQLNANANASANGQQAGMFGGMGAAQGAGGIRGGVY